MKVLKHILNNKASFDVLLLRMCMHATPSFPSIFPNPEQGCAAEENPKSYESPPFKPNNVSLCIKR